jgi:fibronectin type 3 domain-containing protein
MPASARQRLVRLGTAGAVLAAVLSLSGAKTVIAAPSTFVVGASSSSLAYQHPAQDKVAYLHDGSLLVGYFDGGKGVIDLVKNPSTAPSVVQVQSIPGDEVTLYTQAGATTTDIWIQAGAELVGSARLEQVQHGTYDGSTFKWDSATPIPGTISPGRQDPSITWTGKWLIATWWDDTNLSNSDNVFMNWTTDKTGQAGWLATAVQMTTTNQNITQPNIRHSAKLGATVLVYGTHYRDLYRVLLDSRSDPSLGNWTSESRVDPGYDDSEAGFGGPQVAIDESTGKIHVFRAVLNSGGPTWHGVTYWLGNPDAVPMVTGHVSWNARLIIDGAGSTDPVDIAGAVDGSGRVYVFWITSATGGSLKYATLVSPYTSASSASTLATVGSQPRYPHVPAQAPLNRGYVPLVYQSGSSSPYSIVLDTSITAAGGDTAPPSVPTGLSAAAATTGPQVNLAWNASTDNVGVTGYTVYRNGAILATVSGSTPSFADNSVASVTTYSYAVDAFDAAGNHSARSLPVSLTTPDTSPPTVPTGVSAAPVSPGEVDISWSAATDNVGVTGYSVYRNGILVSIVAGSSLTYADATVTASTTYIYKVDAFDAAANHSAQSAPASATTPAAPDTQAPTTPTGVVAKVGPSGEVDVSWGAATDNIGVTGYTVFRDGVAIASVSGTTLAYADKTAAGLTTYSYTIDAFDAAGNHSAPSTPSVVSTPDWTPPTTPIGLLGSVISSSEIDLTWAASTDNVGVAGYTVYRNGTAVGTTAAGTLAYADTGLGHGFVYVYTVDAFDAAGNHSPKSTSVSAMTPDDIPPTTPGGLGATGTSPTNVLVSWTASTDNVAVTGYDVYRDGTLLITLGAATLSYTDTVTAGSTHSYTVDAFDAAGNHSGTPTPVTVTTPTADTTPPSVPTGLKATAAGSSRVALAWNASTDNVGVAGYTIYRNGVVLTAVGGSTLTYSDASVASATNYSYAVDAFDAAGNHSAQSATATVHVPGVPKFVQGAVVTTGSRVTNVTLNLGPVAKGDLLVGWFGQYDSTGQVSVSDNVNGAWIRSASTTWHGGSTPGDIALYYFANAAAAPGGLTITISVTTATYLQGSPAEYSGVATANPLDQVVVAQGSSTSAASGLTVAVNAGELVYGGMTATNSAGTLTPGSSQGVAFVKRAQSTSGTQGEGDIVTSAAGQQQAAFSFPTSTPWYIVCAVFRPA